MDLRRLDLNLLVVLDGLLQEPTITRTAHRLQLSQPTVSASLAKLREVLGDELFVRSKGVMAPTPLAMRLREPVADILRSIRHDVLAQSAFEASSTRDIFSICLSDVGELEFLPGLMDRLSTAAPHAHVRAITCNPEALADAMESGEVDLAIGYFPDLTASVFMQQVLFSHGAACLVRRNHPLYANGISFDQYKAARHIAVETQSRHRDAIDIAVMEYPLRRDTVLTVSHSVNVPALVAQTDLVATISRPVAERFAEQYPLTVLEVPFPIRNWEIKQVWHRRFDNSERLVWLRRLITATSQNQPRL